MSILKGRVAIVTGSAMGIGRELARQMAGQGARVCLCDVSDPVPAVEALRADGHEAIGLVADVSDADAAPRVVQACADAFGRLDILVNNAGLFSNVTRGPFEDLDIAEWRRVLDVNVTGPFLFARAAVPLMRKSGGGRIINISSATVFSAPPMMLHYVTSKGAVTAMTRAMSRELGKAGITVNAIAPGFTLSEGVLGNEALKDNYERARASRAIGRDQIPEDIGGAVIFLASDGAAFITGQTLVVDGGTVLH